MSHLIRLYLKTLLNANLFPLISIASLKTDSLLSFSAHFWQIWHPKGWKCDRMLMKLQKCDSNAWNDSQEEKMRLQSTLNDQYELRGADATGNRTPQSSSTLLQEPDSRSNFNFQINFNWRSICRWPESICPDQLSEIFCSFLLSNLEINDQISHVVV